MGLGKKFNLKKNLSNINYELFINDFIKFHIEWSKKVEDDIQCFTIREIAAIIKTLSPDAIRDKNKTTNIDIYNSIMIIYGARFPKEKKMNLYKYLKNIKVLNFLL